MAVAANQPILLPFEWVNEWVYSLDNDNVIHSTFRASAVTLSISKSVFYHQQLTVSFQSRIYRLPVKTTPRTLRNGRPREGLSRLIQHNFGIFIYFSTILGGEVYVFSFNSCVKFHAKICTHCWNINKSHRRLSFMRPLASTATIHWGMSRRHQKTARRWSLAWRGWEMVYLHSSGHNTGTWRTDRQTDRIPLANTALCIASNVDAL